MKQSDALEDYLSDIPGDPLKICMSLNLTRCYQLQNSGKLEPFHLAKRYLAETVEPCWEDIVIMLCKVFKERNLASRVAKKHGVNYQLHCSVEQEL